jgi:hypothetical protein
MLLQALGLDDDYLLESASATRRVWTCCILLLTLLTKRTLRHTSIKLDTAKRYVHAYASLCALAHDIDIRKDAQTDTNAASTYLKLCEDQRRWEEDPKRKEPWLVAMTTNLDAWCIQTKQHADSLACALSDWFCVGLYTGHRKSEWAQPDHAHSAPSEYMREDCETNIPRAFTWDDVTFHTTRRQPLSTDHVLALPDDAVMDTVGQMAIRWRTQKNGARNQLIFFTPNTKSPTLCCVRRMMNILRRYQRLSGNNRLLPLSQFRSAIGGQVFNITPTNIESVMRATVARWANLDPTIAAHAKVLQQWSSHSLRVGATNLLNANGFSAHQIQTVLRWRSLAFMTYFRNSTSVSDKQNAAVLHDDTVANTF